MTQTESSQETTPDLGTCVDDALGLFWPIKDGVRRPLRADDIDSPEVHFGGNTLSVGDSIVGGSDGKVWASRIVNHGAGFSALVHVEVDLSTRDPEVSLAEITTKKGKKLNRFEVEGARAQELGARTLNRVVEDIDQKLS